MKYYDVVPEAWAPLGGGRYNPFEDEMLKELLKNIIRQWVKYYFGGIFKEMLL